MSDKNPQSNKIIYLPPQNDACAWYRCIVPGMALRERGWHVDFTQRADMHLLKEYGIVIFLRPSSQNILKAIQLCNSAGILTVGEIDDDIWHIDKKNPVWDKWTPEKIKSVEECLCSSRLVTTSTAPLANYLKRFNSNVLVIPNMLPGKYWKVRHADDLGKKVIIGWAGGSSHWSDLEVIKDVIPQVLDEYPNAEFQIAGMRDTPFPEHEKIKIINPVDGEDLAQLLATFNIGVAPLFSGRFNDCKSDLKFLEYAMVGLPVVASKLDAYSDSVSNGENGFLARNSKDWLKYLRRLTENSDLRSQIGEAAYNYAQTRTIEKNIELWEKAYKLK